MRKSERWREKFWRLSVALSPGQSMRRREGARTRDVMIISDVRGEGLEVSWDVEAARRLRGRGGRDSFVIRFLQGLREKNKFLRETFSWLASV